MIYNMLKQISYQKAMGVLYAICATAIWSGNFIIARGLHDSFPPISLAFWRWVAAIIALLPFALKPLINDFSLLRKHLLYLTVTSLLGITIFNTLVYVAGHSTEAINLSLIAISFPVFVIIFARIYFLEKITCNKGLGILIIIVGVVLLISRGNPRLLLELSFSIGDVWMLLSAAFFAAYSILLRKKPAELHLLSFLFCTFSLGLLFLTPFYLWEQMRFPAPKLNRENIISIIYLGVFASCIAFVLWNKAILIIGPTKAAVLYYTLPIFSGGLACVLLDETITFIHLVSMFCIVIGIIATTYQSAK